MSKKNKTEDGHTKPFIAKCEETNEWYATTNSADEFKENELAFNPHSGVIMRVDEDEIKHANDHWFKVTKIQHEKTNTQSICRK